METRDDRVQRFATHVGRIMMICQEIEHSLICLLGVHKVSKCKTKYESFKETAAEHLQPLEAIRRSIIKQGDDELHSLIPDIEEIAEVRNRLAHRVIFSPDLTEYLIGKRLYDFEKDLKTLEIFHEKIQPLLNKRLGSSDPPADKVFYDSMTLFFEETEKMKAEKRKKR